MSKERNSNIELLRIISIIMIVVSHYCVHGIDKNTIASLSLGINRFLLEILKLGNLGSILFIIISGYYLANSNEIKFKKILQLIFQVSFYSILIYGILLFFRIEHLSYKNLILSLFPITFKLYWFASTYIILYIFHPFINKALNCFSRKEHFLLITLMFFLFSVLHTLTTSDYYGNELLQFLLFYSIGNYLSKYPNNTLNNKNFDLKLALLCGLIIALSIIFFDILGIYQSIFGIHSIYLLNRTSPFAILLCVGIFHYFSRKKKKNNKFINTISSTVFGIYLISDNRILRVFIWRDIFKNMNYINSPYLFIHIILTIAITFVVCSMIELIRKYLIEKYLFKILDNPLDAIQEKYQNYINQKTKLKS